MKKFSLKKLFSPLWSAQNRFTSLSVLIICSMYAMWIFVDSANKSAMTWNSEKTRNQVRVVKSEGKVSIGGQFRLKHALGGEKVDIFTEQNLRGKVSLIFFGFTHCPDICPTELSKLDVVYENLSKSEQEQVQIIFVSIDPQRDTPENIFNYVTSFNEKFVALTGNDAQIKHIADAYLVYYASQKTENNSDDYSVDHSGYTYVMGTDGEYIRHFSTQSSTKEISESLKDIL